MKGPFEIPKGKLFTLIIDLDTAKSVSHNQGQGWRLQPVLSISNGATTLGVFRGKLTVAKSIGFNETLLQLYSDDSARLRIASYPKYTLWADYKYNSVSRVLSLSNIKLDTPGLSRRELKEVMKKVPSRIDLPVKQWSLDSIIAVDSSGLAANLYRVDSFSFSTGVSYTEFILNIDYPDNSMIGKEVITEVRMIDTGMPPQIVEGVFESNRITANVPIFNDYIQGSSTRIQIKSYLFDKPDDYNLDIGVFGGLPATYLAGSHFIETTDNPWQPSAIFTLLRDVEDQEFTIAFPKRMNIRMEHQNFSTNTPVVRWNTYPGAAGYIVMVIVKERYANPNKDTFSGSDLWEVAFYGYTKETNITVVSNRFTFITAYGGDFIVEPQINKGDFVRVEVYALDGSGEIDTKSKMGALAMDSLNITR